MKKYGYLALGLASLVLGTLGSLLPVLPTVPFLMLAAFCFARSSEKLHSWFVGTRLYRENLADFAAGRGMTRKAKIRVMSTVTLLMGIGFLLMGLKGIATGCIVLGLVWVGHVIYFVFGIKTIPPTEAVTT